MGPLGGPGPGTDRRQPDAVGRGRADPVAAQADAQQAGHDDEEGPVPRPVGRHLPTTDDDAWRGPGQGDRLRRRGRRPGKVSRVYTTRHGNVLSSGPQGVSLASPEAGFTSDFMAQRGARQPRRPVPHDLIARARIPLHIPVSAEMRDGATTPRSSLPSSRRSRRRCRRAGRASGDGQLRDAQDGEGQELACPTRVTDMSTSRRPRRRGSTRSSAGSPN